MGKRRWTVWAAVVMAVALMAGGCGGGDSSSGDGITVDWGEPQNPLVPGDTGENFGTTALDAMFAGLVKYEPTAAKPVNEMAESITPSPDHRVFTIKLKPGWTFHDGTPVKSKNFVDAWNYTAYAPNGQLNASYLAPIAGYDEVHPSDSDASGAAGPTAPPPVRQMFGLKVIDDTTFQVTLKYPLAIFPIMLGYNAFFPLPDSFFVNPKGFEQHPIGNGPFRFVSRTPNVDMKLTRYDQYRGDDRPRVKNLTLQVYDDMDSAYQDLVSANLDYLEQVPVSALTGDRWRKDLGSRAVAKPGLVIQTISFPLYDPKFRNPDFRKAVSMAIDRPRITRSVFGGSRKPADGWVAPAVDGYVPNQCGEFCQYDPRKAREYLARAGGFHGTLTIESNADGGHKEWSEAVAASIRQTLGINAVFAPTPTFSEFRRKGNHHEFHGMFRTGWEADYPSIESFLTQQYRTGASSNDPLYSNPAFDAALDRANAAPTVEEANKRYQEAERILAQDMPSIPLWNSPVEAGYSDRLSSAIGTPFQRLDPRTAALAK